MTRILVFALCPLPFENTQKNFGPGIRAWQFVKPLLDRGDSVMMIANRIPFIYPPDTPPEVKTVVDGFTMYNMNDRMFRDSRRIQDIHDRFQPEAILAATIFSTPPLADLRFSCPVWIDLFGHVMAEAQAKAYRYRDNSFLEHLRCHEMQAIEIGDVFSTVSRAQEFATIGELGFINRLNSETTGYRFCRTIPCAMDPVLYSHDRTVFRGIDVPDTAFVVLWSGGYNTWTDTDTLFEGLTYAMAENPDIWFVSTGGQIDGHDELTYPAFVEKAQKSQFRDRFIFRGWIPKADVHNYYFESNVGVNIDRYMYEGMLGSKNRVLDWMRAGLPSLIGELCELSYELPALGLAYSYPLHDPTALGRKILELAADPTAVSETGQQARDYGLKHLSFHETTRIFRDWVDHPEPAPDRIDGRGEVETCESGHSVDGDYIQSLLSQIDRKNRHIDQLERYVRHLEKEIVTRSDGAALPADPAQRPALKGLPLPLPPEP
ncbi:MAG TPA: glycosyltransferase, partial [bacterium]|nr:glycosyltransferase [bacterium]